MQQISHTAEQRSQLSTIAMAPVSPALAKLLHQVQAQIIREAGECAELAPDPLGALQAPITRRDDGDDIIWRGPNGREEAKRRRFCPASWADHSVPWHPSHWRIYSSRFDRFGREWSLTGGSTPHVTDDFGNLVPVELA